VPHLVPSLRNHLAESARSHRPLTGATLAEDRLNRTPRSGGDARSRSGGPLASIARQTTRWHTPPPRCARPSFTRLATGGLLCQSRRLVLFWWPPAQDWPEFSNGILNSISLDGDAVNDDVGAPNFSRSPRADPRRDCNLHRIGQGHARARSQNADKSKTEQLATWVTDLWLPDIRQRSASHRAGAAMSRICSGESNQQPRSIGSCMEEITTTWRTL